MVAAVLTALFAHSLGIYCIVKSLFLSTEPCRVDWLSHDNYKVKTAMVLFVHKAWNYVGRESPVDIHLALL